MKQKILEILDKSTSNSMKADEIIGIIEEAIANPQYDMWEDYDDGE